MNFLFELSFTLCCCWNTQHVYTMHIHTVGVTSGGTMVI